MKACFLINFKWNSCQLCNPLYRVISFSVMAQTTFLFLCETLAIRFRWCINYSSEAMAVELTEMLMTFPKCTEVLYRLMHPFMRRESACDCSCADLVFRFIAFLAQMSSSSCYTFAQFETIMLGARYVKAFPLAFCWNASKALKRQRHSEIIDVLQIPERRVIQFICTISIRTMLSRKTWLEINFPSRLSIENIGIN